MMLPFRRELFWDIDFANLNLEKHKRLIIERVITLGNLEEFRQLLVIYKTEIIRQTIMELGYLDPKTMNFVISYFEIDKNQLRCYTKKQSTQQHWN